eukprot:COSAG01_NODE_8387_length_2804_cov_118.059519_1_plen_63_part_00
MEQDKKQDNFINPETDKKTKQAERREPNPKPMNKIFDMKDAGNGKQKNKQSKKGNKKKRGTA